MSFLKTGVCFTNELGLPANKAIIAGAFNNCNGAPLAAGTSVATCADLTAATAPQTLSISGQTLSLSGGGSVTLPAAATPAPQTLSVSGSTLSLSGGGGSVALPSTTIPTATDTVAGISSLAVAANYPSTSDTEAATPAFVAAAIAAAPASVPAATDTVAGISSLAVAANYPSTSDTEAATPAFVAAAIAAAPASVPAATDTVAGISSLAVSANYPSTSATEAATPAYVSTAINAAAGVAAQTGLGLVLSSIPAPTAGQSHWGRNTLNELLAYIPGIGWKVVGDHYSETATLSAPVDSTGTGTRQIAGLGAITVPKTGKILVNASSTVYTPASGRAVIVAILILHKNGSFVQRFAEVGGSTYSGLTGSGSMLLDVVAGDVISLNWHVNASDAVQVWPDSFHNTIQYQN